MLQKTITNPTPISWGLPLENSINGGAIRCKKTARELMKEYAPPEYVDGPFESMPVIVRPKKHQGGSEFHVFFFDNHLTEFFLNRRQEDYYMSYYIYKDQEFRVHMGHGLCLGIQEKTPQENYNWNRTDENPFRTVLRDEIVANGAFYKQLINLARIAMDKLNAHFGGVDIIVKDGQFYFIELNTAPVLTPGTVIFTKYEKYLNKVALDSEYKEPANPDNVKHLLWTDAKFNTFGTDSITTVTGE